MSKKLIITLEGIEGSGKSLHILNIQKYLKSRKVDFIKLREPGGSKNAEKIRSLMLNNNINFNKNTDLLLYMAARSENIEKIIKQNYRKKVILIDRFIDSTIAYQHYGMGINKKLINYINKYLLNKIKVDFTFLNIVNKKNLFIRLNKRKKLNRYDKFKYSFYEKVQNGYLLEAKKNKKKYLVIDTINKISENKKIVIKKINQLLKI